MSYRPPPSAAALLARLVRIADEIIARPHTAFGRRAELAELAVEIAVAVDRPVEDERLIDEAARLLGRALAEIVHGGEADKWLAIADCLRQWVARDLKRAAAAELARATTH